MPPSHDPSKPPIGLRRCPGCGLPLFLSETGASDRGDDLTFECQLCSYAETVEIQFSPPSRMASPTHH